jgi:hypothetical protein
MYTYCGGGKKTHNSFGFSGFDGCIADTGR